MRDGRGKLGNLGRLGGPGVGLGVGGEADFGAEEGGSEGFQ